MRRRRAAFPAPDWWPTVASPATWAQLVQIMSPVRQATSLETKRDALGRAIPQAMRLLERHGAQLNGPNANRLVSLAIAELGNVAVTTMDPSCACSRCLELRFRSSEGHVAGSLQVAVLEA